MRVHLRPAIRRLVDWWGYMIGVVGYAISLIQAYFQPAKSLLSYLEEDMLAWGNLHHPSPVHLKRIEVENGTEPIVAWGPITVELQHTVIERPVE